MITLSGLSYIAASPSWYSHVHHPIVIAFDGHAWRIGVNQVFGPRQFISRDAAAVQVAQAFTQAAEIGSSA